MKCCSWSWVCMASGLFKLLKPSTQLKKGTFYLKRLTPSRHCVRENWDSSEWKNSISIDVEKTHPSQISKKRKFFSFDSKLVSFHSVDLWRTSLFFTGIRWGKREWRNSPVCCGCSAVGQCLQAAAPCMWFLYLLFTFLAGSCVSEPCDSPPPPFVAQVPGHWAGCSAAELGTGTAQYKECRPPSRNQGSKQETRRWWWRSSRQQQGNSSCCT